MPSSLTGPEQKALLNMAASSGAAKACLIEKALACAIGAGVDYRKPRGSMVVDIGAGTTEIAVVTMGCLAQHESLQIAGNTFDEDIRRYVRRERDILIGRLTAEQIKQKIGCAYLRDAEIAIAVKGKSYLTGMPVLFEVNTTEVFLALREHLEQIADSVRNTLARTPPELLADISENGILLTGGCAQLPGIAGCIERKTGISASVANDPANCTVHGIGEALQHMDVLSGNNYFFKTAHKIAEPA
jgi:rod shape-determining protein MreB